MKSIENLTSAELEIYQAGFMKSENDWRRAMGFSDFGEAMYWVAEAKRDLLARHGNIWPPDQP